MEIKFALWRYRKDDFGELVPYDPIVVSSWEEVGKKKKEGYSLQGLTYSVFQMFKGLQYNEDFLRERDIFRKKFNIPARISFSKYLKNKHYFLSKSKTSQRDFTKSLTFQELVFWGGLTQKYRMPYYVKETLADLFYTGIVRHIPPYGGEIIMQVYPKQNWLSPKRVCLEISSPLITKSALKQFIDEHWGTLSNYIAALPTENKLLITDNDLNLMKLRKKYGLLSRVADEVYFSSAKRIKDLKEDKGVNNSAIKTAYFRAKEKIDELFRPIDKKRKKMR